MIVRTVVLIPRLAAASVILVLVACGGGNSNNPPPDSYTVGGTLTGLAVNQTVNLSDNGTDSLTLSKSGAFIFAKPLLKGSSYSVTVSQQPVGQNCVVSNATGSSTSENVATVQVACSGIGQYAYVVNNADRTVGQYSIAQSGTLMPLSPSMVATGNSPRSITVHPSHRYVYVANIGENTISQYVIKSDGTLASNSPATVPTGRGPWDLEFDAQGQFAYVVNILDATVSQYSVDASGVLEAMAVVPVAAGPSPSNITLSPNGKYAYVSNYTPASAGSISQYAIAPDTGELSPLNPASVLAGSFPSASAVDATNSYFYVADVGSNTVGEYSIGSGGELTALPLSTVSVEPDQIAVHPSNKYAYVVNFESTSGVADSSGTVSRYDIAANGQFIPMTQPSVPAGGGAQWMTFDTSGKFLYVVNTTDSTVSEYSVGADGALTSLGTVPTGNNPYGIATTYVGP